MMFKKFDAWIRRKAGKEQCCFCHEWSTTTQTPVIEINGRAVLDGTSACLTCRIAYRAGVAQATQALAKAVTEWEAEQAKPVLVHPAIAEPWTIGKSAD